MKGKGVRFDGVSGVLIAETGSLTEWLRVHEMDDDEGRRLVRIIHRGFGLGVTSRRARMVLLLARGMDAPAIAKVASTSEDRDTASRT